MKNPFDANLSNDALREIRAILEREMAELMRVTSLCSYAPAIETGRANIAKVRSLIAAIDAAQS
jgi:hypothetical protein